MMKHTLARVAVFALLAAPVWAQTPMSADEFDAYTKGKTLFYGAPGAPYGAEQYLSRRRVIWTFLDGECQDGFWYARGDMICFQYDHAPDTPQCWSFFRTPDGLTAQFENDPEATELIETEHGHDPLLCPGPDVGV